LGISRRRTSKVPVQEGEQWYLIALSSCLLHWKCSIQDPPVLSDVVNHAIALEMEGLHGILPQCIFI
jgi:hypothetical protein